MSEDIVEFSIQLIVNKSLQRYFIETQQDDEFSNLSLKQKLHKKKVEKFKAKLVFCSTQYSYLRTKAVFCLKLTRETLVISNLGFIRDPSPEDRTNIFTAADTGPSFALRRRLVV